MIFKKNRKTMTDRPDVSSAPDNATANPGHAEAVGNDPLSMTSEAAAEHVVHDAEADGREDVNELMGQLSAAKAEAADFKDKWIRMNAEFDNFRKRTAKERLELMQFAGENVLKNLLPVLDDMERAVVNNARTEDIHAVREGFTLIQNKLLHILGAQGVKPMVEVKGQPFDTDKHEAITKAPARTPELKGKVIDVVENGYTLHDKVIRYAKVVVGE